MSDLVLFSVFAAKKQTMKITLYREKILSPCKSMWEVWNKMGRQKLQFVFKPLKIRSTTSALFSLSGWVESPCLFLPYRIHAKIVLSIPVIFLFTFFCMKPVGLLLTVFVLAREPREALSGRQLLKQDPGTLGRERSSFNFPCQPFHFNFFLSAL